MGEATEATEATCDLLPLDRAATRISDIPGTSRDNDARVNVIAGVSKIQPILATIPAHRIQYPTLIGVEVLRVFQTLGFLETPDGAEDD